MSVQEIIEQFTDPTTVANQDPAPTEGNQFVPYTAEDLARVRAEEKQKLYPQMEQMKAEIAAAKALATEYAAKDAERDALQAAKDAEVAEQARLEEESKLSDIELLRRQVQETKDALAQEKLDRERATALLEQERQFSELQSYRTAAIEQARGTINPEMLDFVGGNTQEEIDQSVAVLQAKTAAIMESVAAEFQAARQALPGVRVTNPAGPLDNQSEQQQFTPESIKAMTPQQYAQNRNRINPGAVAASRGQGLFSN